MKPRFLLLPATLLPLLLPGCATESASTKAQLSGSLNFRDSIVFPNRSTATIALRDDRYSSPYEAVAVSVVQNPTSAPIAFTLTYDPRKISPQGIYHLDATVAFDGKTRFEQRDFKVLTQGAPADHVELWLTPAK